MIDYRLRLLALLEEMEREDPLTPEDYAAGARLWNAIVSSSTPEPFQPSQEKVARSVRRSLKQREVPPPTS
jgi:hypothetical protein